MRTLRGLFLACFVACGGASSGPSDPGLPDPGMPDPGAADAGSEEAPGLDVAGEEAPPGDLPAADAAADAEPVSPLVVTGVTPGKGVASGFETVTLAGEGFLPGMVVVFDQSLSPEVVVSTPFSAKIKTPPHPPGTVRLVVTNPDGASVTLPAAFTYANPTVVLSVTPDHVPAAGGVPVAIQGAGFAGGAQVIIGGRIAPGVQVIDDAHLAAVAPGGEPGPVDVLVSTASGQAVLEKGLTYVEPPTLTLAVPAAGPVSGGTPVALTGSGFVFGTEVFFGGVSGGNPVMSDPGHLTVTAPGAGGASTVDVTVKTPWGKAVLAKGFTYFEPGTQIGPVKVFAAVPSQGPAAGGNPVAVVASGLQDAGVKVWIGAQPAKVLQVKPAVMTVVVEAPTGAPGKVDVKIESGGQQAALPGGYTYLDKLAVSKVAPGHGPASGGTDVTVTGSGFQAGATVRFGPLPATGVKVVSETTITAKAPPGSPGPVPVTVVQGAQKASLANGFTYDSSTSILAVDPAAGSIGGGTLVHLYGTNLSGEVRVFFGKGEASHVLLESSTEVTCRTPPGPIGAVDVKVVVSGQVFVLPGAYSYYDPLALYGGTWGGHSQGTLNVAVLDASAGQPLVDAFVIVWADATTPFQGFTGPDGVVTFSGAELTGKQMVSASKDCYSNESIVAFDATNVTMYLQYVCPSSGAPPPGVAPGTIEGKVMGLGKYVIPPFGNCWALGTAPDGIGCRYCFQDSDCGGNGNKCLQIADNGTFCTTPCLVPSDCQPGYVCVGTVLGTAQCLPEPLKKTAKCVTTQADPFTENPPPGANSTVDADMHFSITSRLGDVAVICLGGVTDPLTDTFEPYAMGVKRHVAVSPGQLITDVNVLLDIPMTRTFRVYYDDPPAMPGGMGFNYLLVFYDFGADGVFQQDWAAPFAFGDPQVTVTNQPKAFVGTLSDVTFLFLAGVFSATADNTPFTISLHKEVSDLRDDTLLRLDGSTWGVVKSGIKKDVFGMWGTSGSDVFAVGAEGSIYHWDGFGFTQQPVSDVKANLRAVGGSGKTGWAVGDSGTVVRFDDTGWHKADVPAALNRSLTGVSCAAPEDCFAVAWGFAMHWDGKAWTQIQGVPSMELLAVTATGPGEAVAVGSPGQALKLMPSLSLPDSTQIGSRLRAVTVAPDGTVWAAGDNGALVRRTNGYWASVATGTTRPLWAIASSGDRVVAVGDAGTLVRVADNKATSTRVEGYGPHQRAAFGDPDPSGPILAMGISQYLVGPFLPVPEMLNPTENGQLKDLKIQFKTNPGPAAALTYMMIGIPGLFGDTPVWELIQAGDVFETQLPDFEKMEGLPSIPKATLLKLTILRFHKPGLTMDNFDFSDLNQMNAKGWAADVLMFTRP